MLVASAGGRLRPNGAANYIDAALLEETRARVPLKAVRVAAEEFTQTVRATARCPAPRP
jgi:hypothetical protein